jgi:hypothetical protein
MQNFVENNSVVLEMKFADRATKIAQLHTHSMFFFNNNG